jgi:hypothetical protein
MAKPDSYLSSILEMLLFNKTFASFVKVIAVLFIGLVVYTLLYSKTISKEDKKKLSYVQLALSLPISLFTMLYFFMILMFASRGKYVSFAVIFVMALAAALTPFGLTLGKLYFEDKMSETVNKLLSLVIIFRTIIYVIYGRKK